MPNHITSRLKITGEATKVAEVFNFIKADEPYKDGEYCLFDLNKLIPMPDDLDVVSSSTAEDGMKYILAMARHTRGLSTMREWCGWRKSNPNSSRMPWPKAKSVSIT